CLRAEHRSGARGSRARNCYPSTTLPPTDSTAGQLRALLANAQRGATSPNAVLSLGAEVLNRLQTESFTS
ncbi:MAG: hypothetical protein M3361_15565, partial [Candidatus Tectomicrobia bacterium]|nr:hypothetical protein [Candidatus Tectomicrobia bacterium]